MVMSIMIRHSWRCLTNDLSGCGLTARQVCSRPWTWGKPYRHRFDADTLANAKRTLRALA